MLPPRPPQNQTAAAGPPAAAPPKAHGAPPAPPVINTDQHAMEMTKRALQLAVNMIGALQREKS
eukprot:13103199-Alexandrium_andersonii.AAC.1